MNLPMQSNYATRKEGGENEAKKSALRCVYALAAVWRGREGEGEHCRRMRWQRQHKCNTNGRQKEREGETCTAINKLSSWGNQHPLNAAAAAAAAKAVRVGVASSVAAPSCDALCHLWEGFYDALCIIIASPSSCYSENVPRTTQQQFEPRTLTAHTGLCLC